jgi:5'-methylthioadenosine/S-adenosylhomocysteine nucleosidase
MIAIIGVSEDDVLYFKTKMVLEEQGSLYGDILYFKGTLSNQDVVVVALGETNYLSTLLTGIIISKFEPYLIFNIGAVCSVSPQLKQGDVFIPDRYYFDEIDFTANLMGEYGQIPGHGAFIVADGELNSAIESTSYLLTNRYVQRGYMLSGNTFYLDEAPLAEHIKAHFLKVENLIAYDTSSAGVALACQLSKTSLLTIKAVSYQVGREEQKLNYLRKGLEVMPTIGKIITKFLIEKESE